jgi:hypothetical protein
VTINDGKLTMVMGAPINNEYTMLNYLEIESTTRNLSCHLDGNGSGAINSSTPGKPFTCSAGSCNQPFGYNDSINLHPSPASGSTFEGWSGACSGTTDCPLTMNLDRIVNAGFNFCPVRIGSSCYSSLTKVLAAAVNGDKLQSMAYTFSENLLLDKVADITLAGGFDNSYLNNVEGSTTLRGSLTIRKGSLTAKKLIIQ